MKTKTFKLIAAITAFTLLGTAVGVSAFAFNNSTDNDFGFKGTYSLDAFADTATEETYTVDGVFINLTSTLKIESVADGDNEAKAYSLLITIVDAADMANLNNINVGYKIGEDYYNGEYNGGVPSGLTNVVYSSLSINTYVNNTTSTETINASEFKTKNITDPIFIITEVAKDTLSAGSPVVTITGEN